MNILVLLSGFTELLNTLGLIHIANLNGEQITRLYFFLLPLFLNTALSLLLAKAKEIDQIGSVLISIVCYCRLTGYLSINNAAQLESFNSSIFAAIPCAFGTLYALKFFSRWPQFRLIHWRSDLNPRLQKTFNLLVPGLLTMLLFESLHEATLLLSTADLTGRVIRLFPKTGNINEFLELIIFKLLSLISWFLGIHGEASIDGLFRWIKDVPTGQTNAIQLKTFHDVFMNMGGSGSTVVIPFLLLLNPKTKVLRPLAQVSLPFALFNVNEVLLFGLPVILNPVFLVPFLVTPFVNMAITVTMVNLGAFSITTEYIHWMSPPLYSAYVASNGSWAAILTQMFCLAVDACIYWPALSRVGSNFETTDNLKQLFGNDAYSYVNEALTQTEEGTFFDQQQSRLEQIDSAQDILKHLKGGDFILYFQPKVSALNREIVGLEALLRYQDPAGTIHPPTFLPILYRQGLTKSVDKKVVNLVFQQVLQWQKDGFQVPPISINFDKDYLLDDALVNVFLARADELGFKFYIEITEHTYTVDLKRLNQVIHRFRDAGHRISIDDFGAGYSSLTSLLSMSADEIKLDRKLITPPRKERKRGRILLASSVRLCHDLGFTVVAEGIEEEAQFQLVKNYGVDVIQGNLTGYPMSANQVQNLFTQAQPPTDSNPIDPLGKPQTHA